jgi:hypothetical protein
MTSLPLFLNLLYVDMKAYVVKLDGMEPSLRNLSLSVYLEISLSDHISLHQYLFSSNLTQINELPAHDKAGSWIESMEGETIDFTATPHVWWKCGRVKSLEMVEAFKQGIQSQIQDQRTE